MKRAKLSAPISKITERRRVEDSLDRDLRRALNVKGISTLLFEFAKPITREELSKFIFSYSQEQWDIKRTFVIQKLIDAKGVSLDEARALVDRSCDLDRRQQRVKTGEDEVAWLAKRCGLPLIVLELLSKDQAGSLVSSYAISQWNKIRPQVKSNIQDLHPEYDSTKFSQSPYMLWHFERREIERRKCRIPTERNTSPGRDPLDELGWETNAHVEGRKSIDGGWGPRH